MTQEKGGASAPLSISDVLKITDFRQLWFGQLISNFGDALTTLALIFLVNEISGQSATALAFLAIVIGFPTATLGLAAGALVDRLPKRGVMLWSDIARTIVICGYLAFVWFEMDQLWIIYTISFIQATLGAFFNPAKQALIPRLVPQEGLLSANSLSQMTTVVTGVLGAAAAGLIIGGYALYWPVFAVDALSTLFSVYFIWRLTFREGDLEPLPKAAKVIQTISGDIRAGLRTSVSNRLLLGMLLGFGCTMLALGAVNVLLVPLLINDLQVSESWFGLVQLAQSSGMVLSGILVGQIAARFKATRIVTGSLFVVGIAIAGFFSVYELWHIFPMLFVAGLMITPIQAAGATIIQTHSPPKMLGRVGAALSAVNQTASLISMFAAGYLADLWSVRTVFLVGGLMVSAAALLMAGIFRGAPTDLNGDEASNQEADKKTRELAAQN
ncbi:MAG: MFS transporter [Chloroflexota bacterium]